MLLFMLQLRVRSATLPVLTHARAHWSGANSTVVAWAYAARMRAALPKLTQLDANVIKRQ